VHWSGYDATALDIEVDPQRCRFGSRKSDFVLQAWVECRALEPKFRLIAFRWHASGIEVRFGLPRWACRKRRRKNSPCMPLDVLMIAGRKEMF
jgi:hypothetical protein